MRRRKEKTYSFKKNRKLLSVENEVPKQAVENFEANMGFVCLSQFSCRKPSNQTTTIIFFFFFGVMCMSSVPMVKNSNLF